MIPMNNETATRTAVDLAKILCQSAGEKCAINRSTANSIADFIETMEYRLTHKESETAK